MKKRILQILEILAIVAIFMGMTKVYAADEYTCNLEINANKTSIKAGESIIYEIKATNIQAGTGIIIFETLIDYNSDAFEYTVEPDSAGKWNKTSLINNQLTMTRSDLLPNSEDQVIARITFTAKQSINVGTYPVKFTRIVFTMDNDQNFNLSDKSINIQVVANQSQEQPNENENEENTSGENTSGENTSGENTSRGSTSGGSTIGQNSYSNQNSENSSTSEDKTEKMPYTGPEDNILVFIILAAIIVSIGSYIRYKKIDC